MTKMKSELPKLIGPEDIGWADLSHSWSCIAGEKLALDLFEWRKKFWEKGGSDRKETIREAIFEIRRAIGSSYKLMTDSATCESQSGMCIGFLNGIASILAEALAQNAVKKNAEQRFSAEIKKLRELELELMDEYAQRASSIAPETNGETLT